MVEAANIQRQTQTEKWAFFVPVDGPARWVDLNTSSMGQLFGLAARPLCHSWYALSPKWPLRDPVYGAYILDSEKVDLTPFHVNERGTVLACQLGVFRPDELLNIRGPICITGPRDMALIPQEREKMEEYILK